MAGLDGVPVSVLEIGGTHVTAAVVDLRAGQVLQQRRRPLDSGGTADEIVDTLAMAARSVNPPGQQWGVAIPGPFDYENGIGRYAGVNKFDSLAGVDLGAALRDRLGPRTRVAFVNDADAFGLGEAIYGAGRGHRRILCVTVGTGIGSAFIADCEMVKDGPDVPPHGYAYLLTWHGRPIEETVSSRAIRHRFAALAGGTFDVAEIAELARGGSPLARRVFDETFHALGYVLAPCAVRFRATALVLGGSIAESFDLIELPLRDGLTRSDPPPDLALAPAELPDTAALLGGAHAATGHSAGH